MDITLLTDKIFKIKGKTGIVTTDLKGPTIESPTGEKMTFTGPGEYEVFGISVIGISYEGETIYIYEIDKLRVCYLGKYDKKLPENILALLGSINVLLISPGSQSVEIVQQIESHYVIPYGYENQEELDKFLRESSLVVEKKTKFSLKKEDYLLAGVEDNPTQIIVLGKD